MLAVENGTETHDHFTNSTLVSATQGDMRRAERLLTPHVLSSLATFMQGKWASPMMGGVCAIFTCHSVWWKCYLPVLPCHDEDVIGNRLGAVQRLHDWKLRVCTLESRIFFFSIPLVTVFAGLAQHSLGRHLHCEEIWRMMTDFPRLMNRHFQRIHCGFTMMDTRKAWSWEIN